MNAVELLNNAPEWFQRDARHNGVSVDLRYSSGYEKLMGHEFFSFFLTPENCEGRNVEGWNWRVTRVDGLVNFYAWRNK